jgi:hypothetical protein
MSAVESTARHLTAGHVFAAPPIATAAAVIGGLGLQQWVYVVAILSGLVSIVYTVWRWVHEWRDDRKAQPKPTVPQDK